MLKKIASSLGIIGILSQMVLSIPFANAETTYLDGSSEITNISFEPYNSSSKPWTPSDEELLINWDLEDDFDELTIKLKKSGATTVEIYNEEDLDDDGYDLEFDGLDDDNDYLEEGTWRVVFTGEIDGEDYLVEENLYIKYDTPSINDTFVTKSKIDPDHGEGTYFVFKLDDDAVVDVDVLEGSSAKVSLLEDEDVDADKWYAVYWDGMDDDGDDFDYDDSFKIRLKAKNTGDNDAYSTVSETVDLAEDTVSNSKANVLDDEAIPPIVEENDSIAIRFLLEATAKVQIGIYQGTSTSGTADYTALSSTQKTAGNVKAEWEADDDGLYVYKITSTKVGESGAEEETGKFVVGDLGEIFGNGGSYSNYTNNSTNNGIYCGRFSDVPASYRYCEAIKWVTSNGMFSGYENGTFKPYDPISRIEVLAVILRAVGTPTYEYDGIVLPWGDIDKHAWYMPYLRTGKSLGFIDGYNDRTVRPNNSVSRGEFLKILYLADFASVETCSANPYQDVYLGVWYSNYICQGKEDELFDISSSYFAPNAAATRGEVANALYKFFSNK